MKSKLYPVLLASIITGLLALTGCASDNMGMMDKSMDKPMMKDATKDQNTMNDSM